MTNRNGLTATGSRRIGVKGEGIGGLGERGKKIKSKKPSQTQRTVWRGAEGWGGGGRGGQRGQTVVDGAWTWGGEHTVQCTGDVG